MKKKKIISYYISYIILYLVFNFFQFFNLKISRISGCNFRVAHTSKTIGEKKRQILFVTNEYFLKFEKLMNKMKINEWKINE